MLYIASGEALLTVQGKTYDIQKSSIVFISRYEEHNIIGKGDYKCYFILMYAQTIDEVISDKMLCSVFKNRDVGFSHVYDVSDIADRIESQFQDMVAEYHNGKPYSGNMISLILREMLIEVLRLYPNAFHPISSQIDEEISKIQEQIDINCTAELKITEVAEKFYISPQHLSKVFKKRTGHSPKQYLTQMRISKAKELLVNTSLSVQEISSRSGFGDESNFIRIFKKYVGVTPNKYRINQRDNLNKDLSTE